MSKIFKGLTIFLLISCSSSNNTMDLNYGDYSQGNFLLNIGAHSTIRTSETTLDVLNPTEAVYTVKKALTIHHKEDKELANVYLLYGQFQSIDYLNANVIDKSGQIVQSYTIKDALDYSTAWGSTFFSDDRLKVLELPYNSFPYTVEIEYQQKYKGLLNLPDWEPQRLGQSVESATFTLIDRQNTGVRFFNKNIEIEPEKSIEFGVNTLTWKVENLKALERESRGPHPYEILPRVLVAPGTFTMEKSVGDATTWESFGKWYYELGKDTRTLPEEAKAEIDALVKNIESEEEKVEILFNYLQEKSRYVLITLGIGGWKPYSAEYVYNNSYGDCKALTNYMQAVLEYVGIKAESVLIRNGVDEPEMEVDFPSNQFNHVIIRVTLDDGNIVWLECTSKYLPPNHIGSGNSGKNALLITEDGGRVIETPLPSYLENSSDRYMRFVIDDTGTATVESEIINKGILQDDLLYTILPVSEKERTDWLEETLIVDESKLMEYDFNQINEHNDYAKYSFKADLNNFVNSSSKRLFIPVNKMNRWRFTISEDEERTQPIHLYYTYVESDSIVFEIPANFEIEAIPKELEHQHTFGEFKTSFEKLSDNELLFKRRFALKEKKIRPEDYTLLQDFFDNVRFSDQQQIVLVKKEEN